MQKTIRVMIFVVIVLSVIAGGCERKREINNNIFDLTKEIKSTTGDYLVANTPIEIILQEGHNLKYHKGKKVEELDFTFEPHITGRSVWIDKNTINFIPKGSLGIGREYECTILPAGRSAKDSLVTPVTFHFTAIGQDVTELNCEINFEKDDSDYFRFSSKIKFLTAIELTDLNKASKITYGGNKYNINWKEEGLNSFNFISEKIRYQDSVESLEFFIKGSDVQLAYDIDRQINIQDENELIVKQAAFVNEETPYIKIEFSDDIAKNQDLYYMIRVTSKNKDIKEPEISLDVNSNIVRVYGDFLYRGEYLLTIIKDIVSTNNKVMSKGFSVTLAVEDQNPRLVFSDDGVFLTSANKNNLYFRTINVKTVNYEVVHVYENNMCQFLQDNTLRNETSQHSMNNLNRVGKQVAEGKLEIGETRNTWLQHELNISELLPAYKYGVYVVKLSVTKNDVLYRKNDTIPARYSNYGDPLQNYYYYRNGTIIKPVIVSDLAITHKQGGETSLCMVSNVLKGKPESEVHLSVYNFQNQILAEGYSDKEGYFQYSSEDKPFFVAARKKDQQSLLKLGYGNSWETSTFDVGGVTGTSEKLQAYIYTERGVYRPGDEINFAIIMRNPDGSFPENHPLGIEIYDPHQVKIYETVLKNGKGGFYHLPFSTETGDPTGTWQLKVNVGDNEFRQVFHVETIAAERLKISFEPQADKISASDEQFDFTLTANYLFGSPAAGLQVNFSYNTTSADKSFSQTKWNRFSFVNASQKVQTLDNNNRFNSVLDEEGKSILTWERPEGNEFRSAGLVRINADVIDKGGRASKESIRLLWDPWEYYVGLHSASSYLSKDEDNEMEIVLLDTKGELVAGQNLQVRVYENDSYWWWEYDNYSSYRMSYKQAESTHLVQNETILSGYEPIKYKLPKVQGHNILVEVTHQSKGEKGHVSSKFFYTSRHALGRDKDEAGLLEILSDKTEYKPGEIAHLSFPVNSNTRTMVTVEKEDQILDWWWYESPAGKTQADVKIAINKDMQPGVYTTISVIQGQLTSNNDRPLRMYGIIPLKVIEKSTIEYLEMKVPEIICPQEKFTCEIQATPGRETQITVAVVDEGLLSLMYYVSPDPWNYFYRKKRLEVESCDNFDKIIDLENGDIASHFAIGGGIYTEDSISGTALSVGSRQVELTKMKRFKPVSMFSGIITADKNGKAKVEFMMPDYLGAVRIMAVSASGNRFGSAAKTVAVRKELMVNPTLPRALAPGDKFSIPVEVFSFEEAIKGAQVNISATGPITFTGGTSAEVTLNDRGEGLVFFTAEMQNDLDPVSITVRAQSGKYEHERVTDIPVRPLQPFQLVSEREIIQAGKSTVLDINKDGLKGTESSQIVFSRPGFFNYNKHFKYLVRYPYGCLEQTVSSVFPQLFISSLIDKNTSAQLLGNIDRNIEKGLQKMAEYQNYSGGFGYWRGSTTINLWSTIYTAHFLIEASERGYYIPGAMLEKALNYMSKTGISGIYTEDKGLLKVQSYQLYVLARAGKPQINMMNYLWQNRFQQLDNTNRWLLAGAYQAAGQSDMAAKIAKEAGKDVNTVNSHYRYNYGSNERDRAIILAIASDLGQDEIARKLYDNLAGSMNENRYYSTQSRAFMLWALSSYAEKHPEMFSSEPVKGYVEENGQKKTFDISGNDWKYNLNDPDNIKVILENDSAPAAFTLYYDRIPAKAGPEITNSSFSLKRKLTDSNKKTIALDELKQGEAYTLSITLTRKEKVNVENMALTQILPTGWEIINERLEGNNSYNQVADYIDIRDDRIMWFFDFKNRNNDNSRTYKVKIRAVTAGEFELPPTYLEAMYQPDYTVSLPGGKIVISK